MTVTKDDATPSTRQYLDIKSQYEEYLLFYRVGDFYELFFDDAIKASNALNIQLTKKGSYKGEPIPMCGVPHHAYENYLTSLIKQGYKVAICEQTETPEEAKKRGGSKALVNREVIRLVTSGTLTEDALLDVCQNNYLLSCFQTEKEFGFAWVDLSTGDFYTRNTTFDVGEQADVLHNFLAYIDAGEIIVSDVAFRDSSIFNILRHYKDKLTVLPQARFNAINAQKMLEKFYNIQTIDAFGSFTKTEIISAGIVLDYIETTQKGKLPQLKHPVKYTQNQFLEIDASTRQNLELTDANNKEKKSTLLGNINRTITACGSRLLNHYLKNPSLDIKTINQRLDLIEFFIRAPEIRKKLRECLRQVSDIEKIIARMSLNRCPPTELFQLGETLSFVPKIRNLIYNIGTYNLSLEQIPVELDKKLKSMADFSALVTEIGDALKEYKELPNKTNTGNFIRSGYNARLDQLQEYTFNQRSAIEKLEKKYCDETGISNLKIRNTSILGYFIEVPAKMAKEMIQLPQFIHRQSVLSGARFTTVELNEMEQELNSAGDKALALEFSIYDNLIDQALCATSDMYNVATIFAELDVASSLADLAIEKKYCRPIVDDSLDFIIKDGKHPVVESAIEKAHDGTFVGNDCSLNGIDNRIWLITGPNMAGKSTFLRQNAIIAILAQIGSYVPCSYAKIGLIDKIFSRVGASDDLSRGRSTFMVEMVETASILNQATERSFVILDEIGRGTATYDGLSIAWSVIEHLHEVNKCRALFATHYHELTVLSNKLTKLSLHCMKIKEFNGNVIFLHQVIDGAADRSYGIHVAKLAGIPQVVIARAEQILQSLEQNPNKTTISDIENDLPLFSVLKKEHKKHEETAKPSPALDLLKQINPDSLTPREALDKIYELKKLAD
ncbi:MAG: DNA mismatch repair protein MutS [Alphaproteobacteria bacterium]|nr:DNA mismatch repair protein MutS [Alphaproteobacteria bacterium]